MVLEDVALRHRLTVVRSCPPSGKPAFLVGADKSAATRLAALRAFLAAGDCTARCAGPSVLEPTLNQRYRLTLLLQILDWLQQASTGDVSLRRLASEIVYRRELPERAIEWKSSSRRRQTQRLVSVARYMAEGGYRRLLNGRALAASDSK